MSTRSDDGARGRSLSQYALDSLALALLVGAGNGLVVGLLSAGIIGMIFGAAFGASVAVALWVPGVAATRCLVLRQRAGRLSSSSLVRGTTIVGLVLGITPATAFLLLNLDASWPAHQFLDLVGIAALGGVSGAWAGRKLGRLQLARAAD